MNSGNENIFQKLKIKKTGSSTENTHKTENKLNRKVNLNNTKKKLKTQDRQKCVPRQKLKALGASLGRAGWGVGGAWEQHFDNKTVITTRIKNSV